MKATSLANIKAELKQKSQAELLEICLKLTKFKVLNKEYLTYLLFESENEVDYIIYVKEGIHLLLNEVNTTHYYYMKKGIRKTMRYMKKCISFSKNKQTEVDLLAYFLNELSRLKPNIFRNKTLTNLYGRQLEMLKRKLNSLHEDIQGDYKTIVNALEQHVKNG